MQLTEAKAVLGQLTDYGRVRRWFGLGARAEELFYTFAQISDKANTMPERRPKNFLRSIDYDFLADGCWSTILTTLPG